MTKTYGVFNRSTASKTGNIKVTRKFVTREQARMWLRSNSPVNDTGYFRHGIVNLEKGTVIR